ncbi:MAG TPA: MmgE/PrpD family protein [Solirubrobacteraceae bacterium]|nr:MmgE/PrpD family protein [Solirubrobacteraceae bacterium]
MALAQFVSRFELARLPERASRRLAQCVLDFIGVAAAGRVHAESSPAFVRGVIAAGPAQGPATVIGARDGLSCRDAALLNGTFAHSLDFDDTNLPSLVHAGAAVLPAALALAERDDRDGTALLAAAAAGYEVACRVGLALGPGAYARGFHPTAVGGLFGAVAAGAHLLRMDEDELASAFGLAGSMACGSMEYLESGSWNKRLHAGLAASNALLAVELARAGVRGAAHALEGRSGVLHSYTDAPRPEALTDALGERWLLAETGIKPYPACRLAHGAIDAAFAARERVRGGLPAGVEISLRISPEAYTIVGGEDANKRAPQNVVDAQFSAYFLTAVALLDGAVSWASYERIGDPDVKALIARIALESSGDVPSAGALLAWRSPEGEGQVRVEQPAGEPRGALAWEDVEPKYRALARELFDEDATAAIAEWVKRLPSDEPVRTLTGLLRSASTRTG